MNNYKLLASQAQLINRYKNTRSKLQKCCANIYFNKQCLVKQITPAYVNVRIANTSPASLVTTKKAQTIRIKDEIKFLHKKKDKLNKELYNIHLKAAQEWDNTWHIIQESILESINKEMQRKYKNLDEKLEKLTLKQPRKPNHNIQFYPRVINETKIEFSKEEITLLNKGPKYNLSHKKTHWLKNIAFEAENAITLLPTQEQDYLRYQVAQNLQVLHKQQKEHHTKPQQKSTYEYRIIKQIKEKLEKERAMITRADKSNSIIIIYTEDYNKKVNTFITNNSFHKICSDLTKKLQRNVRNTIHECQNIIPKEERWKVINLNPSSPSIRGLIKIHKIEAPIRPVVNWKNAPAYKLARTLAKKLQTYTALPYCFNVKNTTSLITDLQGIPYDQNLRLASFDITNMYTNIPKHELPTIINDICKNNHTDPNVIEDIIKLTTTITDRNYFQFMNENYIQTEGLAMGTPTSAILSEIYLQFLENNVIYNILKTHKITGYFRYVDDILIIYNNMESNIYEVLNDFNQIAPKLKFTIEEETERKLNFLDITIQREQHHIATSVYRKPTTTDTIIPSDSCHPIEQKMAAIRYLCNRMHSYRLNTTNIQKEKEIIQQILVNNKYDPSLIQKNRKKVDKVHTQKQDTEGTKWAKFTHIGKETRFITKIFRRSNVKIALTTNNTIEKLLTSKQDTNTNKYDKAGIYQLRCPTCDMKYIGQTGRPFKTRFHEHLRDFKYNNRKSKFAQHLLDSQHSIDEMENIMDVIHITNKGRMMNTIEKYYIYRETKLNNQINDKLTVQPNVIFETLVQQETHRGQSSKHNQQTSY